jgi:hypothetical protein
VQPKTLTAPRHGGEWSGQQDLNLRPAVPKPDFYLCIRKHEEARVKKSLAKSTQMTQDLQLERA